MRAVLLPLLVAMLLGTSLPPASADHPQQDGAVSFDHITGNDWWVEVALGGTQTWDAVSARDEGGPWVPLEKRSWGVWAASFRIEPGHDVRFQARTDDGSTALSCWFSHPTGVERCDATMPDPDLTFDHTGGNEWWVQVAVHPHAEAVEAMDTGGPWTPLQLRHWGDWAASFRIELGHDVRFRALVDGAWAESCWFRHPTGTTPTGGGTCGPSQPPSGPPMDVAFGPKAGNAWWVETYVVADAPIHVVETRVDGGAWHALRLRDWGAWAASLHAPDGSHVEFRATGPDGTDTSHRFHWPQAKLAGGDGDWPEEGSYTRNRMYNDPPGGYHANGWATDIYHDGRWWRLHSWDEGYEQDTQHHTSFSTFPCKMYGPTMVQPGQDVLITRPCEDGGRNATVRGMQHQDIHLEGDATRIDVWHASDRDPCGCLEWAVRWDDDTGMVTHAVLAGRGASGHVVVDTDAPLT